MMVEWKRLGEVISVHTGSQLNRNDMLEQGICPVINGGRTPSGYTNEPNENGNSITISQGGESAGFVNWIDCDFWAGAHCYVVECLDDTSKRYVYHFLKNSEHELMASKQGAGIPGLNRKNLYKLDIPVPSISEQTRIVGILDTFTASIENLKQQIAQRRKQYEHYRDQLLDLEGKEGVEMKMLGDLGPYFGGLTGKTKEDFVEGNAKFITYMNVFANPALDITKTGTVKINEGEKQNKVQKGDILFTGSSETPEEAGMSCVVMDELENDYYLNSFCFGIHLNHLEQLNLGYLKHILRSDNVRKGIAKSASGVTRFNISKARFGKVSFPSPSFEEQQRIVSILDTFEASIANLEQQLAQREKQYEYYRNKLLKFD
jgi:type I restriction enzyme S subunit